MRSKILIVVVVLAVIVGIGVGVGLLAGRGPGGSVPVATQVSPTDTATPHPTIVGTQPKPPTQNPIVEVNTNLTIEPTPMVQASNITLASTNLSETETNWEDKIDEIVGSDDADTNKVKQLFAMFPKLPADGQEEVVQHLSNLVEDDDYKPLGELLRDDKLPEGVLDELLADVLNRPNNVKLPALLDVSCDTNHAKHDEAKDLLELYLGDDYGSDCDAWRQHMTTWLQQNPD
jgi:hypothetical protein